MECPETNPNDGMPPLSWCGRYCFIVARTARGWPVIHFDDEGVEMAVELSGLQAANPRRNVKALTRIAPPAAHLIGD